MRDAHHHRDDPLDGLWDLRYFYEPLHSLEPTEQEFVLNLVREVLRMMVSCREGVRNDEGSRVFFAVLCFFFEGFWRGKKQEVFGFVLTSRHDTVMLLPVEQAAIVLSELDSPNGKQLAASSLERFIAEAQHSLGGSSGEFLELRQAHENEVKALKDRISAKESELKQSRQASWRAL